MNAFNNIPFTKSYFFDFKYTIIIKQIKIFDDGFQLHFQDKQSDYPDNIIVIDFSLD